MLTISGRNPHVGFMVAPLGQFVGHFAYQDTYWLPDAVQAQDVILPEHRAKAHVQQQLQRAVA